MLLWNAILPDVTGVEALGYWQGVGLLVLSRILFGGWRGGGKPGGYANKKYGHRGGAHWREKWMNMSEEERLKMKQQWRERCKGRWSDQVKERPSERETERTNDEELL